LPDLEDLKKSCQDIIKENISEKVEYKMSNAEKMATFMFKINQLNDPNIGIWSMRNIRKIFRRNAYQQLNQNSYINVSSAINLTNKIIQLIPKTNSETFEYELNKSIFSFCSPDLDFDKVIIGEEGSYSPGYSFPEMAFSIDYINESYFAVLGLTGAGKSSFLNAISDTESCEVGKKGKSFT